MPARRVGGDAREVGDGDLVLVDGLEGHQLVRVGRDHRRLVEGNHGGFERAGVERLVVGRHADAGGTQVRPQLVPLGGVGFVEGHLAVGGVERLAALAQPVLVHRLGDRAVGDHRLEGLADRGQVGIGGVGAKHLDAGLLEIDSVDHQRHRVGAEADAVELAVDLAAIKLVLVEIAQIQGAADELVERGNGVPLGVFDDVAVIHLNDVGGIAAGGLGGELGPVIVPGEELAFNRRAAVLGVEVGHPIGAVGTSLAAPEDQAQGLLCKGRRNAGGGGERRRAEQKLTAV